MVGGKNFNLAPPNSDTEWQVGSVTFRFQAILAPARYHVTIKLMNGRTEETSLLIDKQVGVLSFDTVARGSNSFLGIVDLGIEANTRASYLPDA